MGQAVTNLGAAAVKEGQRCFDVPLDTTMQNIRQPRSCGGTQKELPDKFYSLGLGSGVEEREASVSKRKLPGSTADGNVPPPHAMLTGGYPRHGDFGAASCQTEHMPLGAVYAEEERGGYVDEPMSTRELFDHGVAQTASPSIPPREWSEECSTSSNRMPPPPPQRSFGSAQGYTSQAPAPPPVAVASAPLHAASDEEQRSLWTQGSVLEIYSASANRWYPALLLRVQPGEVGMPDVLTMQFWLSTDEAKQKSLYRNDAQQLAPLGTHLVEELPPGFCLKPSQSRPGQNVFQDLTTGTKYQTVELAWQTHFQRLLERPALGMETVCHLPNAQSLIAPSPQVQPGLVHASSNISTPVQHCTSADQEHANAVAAGLVTEYEAACSVPPQQQHGGCPLQTSAGTQAHPANQPRPEGPRMLPQQLAAAGPMASQRSGGSGLPSQQAPRPEGPQIMDCRRAIRA
jgi:hypothetical protein